MEVKQTSGEIKTKKISKVKVSQTVDIKAKMNNIYTDKLSKLIEYSKSKNYQDESKQFLNKKINNFNEPSNFIDSIIKTNSMEKPESKTSEIVEPDKIKYDVNIKLTNK